MKKILIFILGLFLLLTSINTMTSSAKKVQIKESKTFTVQDYDKVTAPFGEKLIAVKKNGKWGFMNVNGEMAIKPQFQGAHNFFEGRASVKINGKWGYIDKTGKMVIKAEYDQAAFEFFDGYAQVSKKGKWGNIDRKGNVVIPLVYEDTNTYSDGLILVKKNGKFGYINNKNKMVIPPQFTDGGMFKEGLAAVKKGGKWGFIDKKGNLVIPYKYAYFTNFNDGVAVVQNNSNSLYGAIDKKGKTLIKFKYNYLTYPNDGLIGFIYEDRNGYDVGFISAKTGKRAFKITPTNNTPNQFREGLTFMAPMGTPEYDTIYTKSGQKIKLKNKYYTVMFFNNGYALGIINESETKIKVLQQR